jgi:sporulation protein YlmC with PRC-barrel domain
MSARPDEEYAMPGVADFVMGTEASCTDGQCGKVIRVVIDPVAEAVTHVVIEPTDGSGPGRLVPLDLITAGDGDELRLSCSLADFRKLDPAEETRFVPGSSGYPAYGPGEMLAWPYYSLGGGLGLGSALDGSPLPVTYDSVPVGEVSVRRGDTVHATDGDIGRVQGLVIDPSNHHVTHVLLQEGHLWGRKDVSIPITAVARTDDGIHLNISKQDVQDLPPVDLS